MNQHHLPIESYSNCKYCKKIVTNSKDCRCQGPCNTLMHFTCASHAYHNHMMMNISSNNFYCVTCSVIRLNESRLQTNTSASSESCDMSFPSFPKTDPPPYPTSYTNKTSDMKNQAIITTSLPEQFTLSPPKVNISTNSISPTKEFLDVKDSRPPTHVTQYNAENYFDFQGYITQIYMDVKKCVENMEHQTMVQLKTLTQESTQFELLKGLQTELTKGLQTIGKSQLHIIAEIETLTNQYQEIKDSFAEIKSQLVFISEDQKLTEL